MTPHSASGKSRRRFIKKALSTAIITGAAPLLPNAKPFQLLEPTAWPAPRHYGANDQVNVAVIGMGIMGFNNADVTQKVSGVKLVGVCDLYTGHLDRARELHGKDIFTTRNYKEILDRKDIDAVIIATSDHWHDRISIEAMNKGKHVYCEKPMVHKLEEGAEVIATQQKTGKVFQMGSQRASSIITAKAREIIASGAIGDLVVVDTYMDRHTANGAWQYSIPTDARNNTVDWESFIGDAPKIAYDPVRFFRWRNYQDYGTGVAGDLFVHLFTTLHCITGSKGPQRAFATGGLRYWKDGRDAPDVMLGIFDYPASDKHAAFNLQMRVNFVDGSEDGERLRLVGTAGAIELGGGSLKVIRNQIKPQPGYGGWDTFNTFTEAQQKEYIKWYNATYPASKPEVLQEPTEFKIPQGYSANLDHHQNFYAGIREGKPVVEDAWFSLRASGPALLANKSYYDKKIIQWDPENARVIG
jgi:predicted dehydrogenase